MPLMNFDLEDGLPPVSFVLNLEDCDRFMKFMGECTEAIKDRESAARAKPSPVLLSDTTRLNWLATNPRGAEIVVAGQSRPCVFWGVSAHPDATLREAIDALMLAVAPEPKA